MWDFILCAAPELAQAVAVPFALWASRQLWRLLVGVIAMGKAAIEGKKFLNAREAGERIGLTAVQVTRTYERGFMPPAMRLGRVRMIPVEDLSALKEAAKEAGYLK